MGLGCVEVNGTSFTWIGHRVVRVAPGKDRSLALILREIHVAIEAVLSEWRPTAVAAEEVFFAKNAQSALMLGQARGAALVCAAMKGLPLFEYPATVVKQAVTGSGRAEKEQVQRMVRAILGGAGKTPLEFTREDASDALAVAICHLQHRHKQAILQGGAAAAQGAVKTPAKKIGPARAER